MKNEERLPPLEFDQLIGQRRSIRKYLGEMPPKEWIEGMVTATAQAPSPSNSQPVRILCIRSQQKREALYQALKTGRKQLLRKHEDMNGPKRIKNWINSYYRFSEFMFDAPLLFAFGIVTPHSGFSKKMQQVGLLNQDNRQNTDADITVGLALKAFILKATAYGLGTCILTAPLVFIETIEDILELDQLRIACLVTAGFPDETPAAIQRKSVAEIYSEI